jgi:hypothetical protein
MARGPPVAGLTRIAGGVGFRTNARRRPGGGRPPAGLAQLPQGATLRQFGTMSLTVWVPVAP